jgi:hypothetical protein
MGLLIPYLCKVRVLILAQNGFAYTKTISLSLFFFFMVVVLGLEDSSVLARPALYHLSYASSSKPSF